MRISTRRLMQLGLVLGLSALAAGRGDDRAHDPAVGTAYQVPYRLTLTNHYLVRVRVNGKGPFNFLVDTGAPALYVSTEVAQKIGLKPSKTSFWTDIERFDIEGGATLQHVKARVDDPFQLTGMNALGLPGASIDGILGFTILARFRMEFDPTRDRMVWTLLDYQPKEPPVPHGGNEKDLPAELQAMNLLGPIAKFAALFVGKQPEEQLHPRAFLGMELAEDNGQVRVSSVLADSPTASAGVRGDDYLIRLRGQEIHSLKEAWDAVFEVRPGDALALTVRRGPGTVTLTLRAAEGF
ncbi:MAG TPA: aspartyl protease family protein [Isosphaeraceae bacterium]|nr:aspartyl protease family protein [Isosphaeraceae bacterium]